MEVSPHTKISTGNDNNADKYDAISKNIKGTDIIKEEIEIMLSLYPESKTVLDLGCGTGRHSIPLAASGKDVTSMDISTNMLDILKAKVKAGRLSNIKILNADFLAYDFKEQKFDLIILMWNALNEIALSDSALKTFFEKLTNIMHTNSKVLINIDNIEEIDLENIDHELAAEIGDKVYRSRWRVSKFDKRNNLTVSKEQLFVFSKDQELLESSEGEIIQKWWRQDEISKISDNFQIRFKNLSIKGNRELYLVGTKIK